MKSIVWKCFRKVSESFLRAPGKSERARPALVRYGIGIVAVLVFFGLRLALSPWAGHEAAFVLFVPAIIIAGFSGGFGPALLACALSLTLANHFLSATEEPWIPRNLHEFVAGFAYIFSALVVVALTAAVRMRAQELQTEIEQRTRTEEELRRSEERFRRIFESAAVGVVQIDSNGKFVNANPKFCQITGYSIGELLQQTFLNLTLPEEREDEMALFRKAQAGELPVYQSETRLLRKDEKTIWTRTTTSLLRSARGSPEMCIVIVEDITAHKHAEIALREYQRKLQEIADNSPAMIFVKDTAGHYLFCNRHFEAITHKDIIGKTDRELFPPMEAAAFQANDFRVLETGSALEFEETAMHDDGPHVSIAHKFPLRNSSGEIYAIGGIATDITQRKQVEEDLRKTQEGYANLVSSIDGIVWESDAATLRFSFVSQKAERFLLYPIKQWLTEPDFWKNHLHPDDRDWAVEFCLSSVRKKKDHDFEYRMLTADGCTVWLRDIVSVVVEPDGAVKLRGVMVDITEQKKAEEALRKSEEKYRSLYKNTPVMMHSIDPEGKLISVSNRWLETLGYKREEVIGRNSVEFLTAESKKRAEEIVLPDYYKTGVCNDVPYQFIKKNGETIDTLLSAIAEKDLDGNVIRSLAVIIDVTAQKRTERALRESEERLRILTETAADAIVSTDHSGNIIQFNRSAQRVFGYSGETVLGKPIALLMPENFEPDEKKFLQLAEQNLLNETTESIGRKADGSTFPLELSLSTGKTSTDSYFIAIIRDITERKRAEETLRRNEELLRMTTEAAQADLWSWDIVRDELECPSIHEPFGFDHPIPLHTYLNYIHPEDRARLKAEADRCIENNSEFNVEFRVLWPDGTCGWRHSRGRPLYVDGRPVRFSGISLDITQRKEAEEALRHSEELLRMTTESAGIGLWSWNILTDVVEWNPVEYEQFGLRIGATINSRIFLNCVHPEDRDRVKTEFERSMRDGKEMSIEHRILRPDGTIRWNHCKGRTTYANNIAVRISGMSLDITERKAIEHKLQEAKDALARHAEELEERVAERTAQLNVSLKDMEGFCYNIAHDLRAPLRAMRGFVAALSEDFGEKLGEPASLYCDRIAGAANRMDVLISDLLAFGRLSHLELPTEPVNLTEEIKKVLSRSAREIQERHAEIELAEPLPEISADAPVLDQVLENLITNAVKFVPPERKPHVHIYAESHENDVRLWVEDNGIGIAPEYYEKVFGAFERLHTTDAYPGTGMGLAIVQRAVEKMGGHVGVESELGKGSRFWIELPKVDSHRKSTADQMA